MEGALQGLGGWGGGTSRMRVALNGPLKRRVFSRDRQAFGE